MSKSERTCFQTSEEFLMSGTSARHRDPSKMILSTYIKNDETESGQISTHNKRIRKEWSNLNIDDSVKLQPRRRQWRKAVRPMSSGVSPPNGTFNDYLNLPLAQFGDCAQAAAKEIDPSQINLQVRPVGQFAVEGKTKSFLNGPIRSTEANPGPSRVPKIWPTIQDKGTSVQMEIHDLEKPNNDLRQKLNIIKQAKLLQATPGSSTKQVLQTLLDVPSKKRKREESDDADDEELVLIKPPQKRKKVFDGPQTWISKKRKRIEMEEDEGVRPQPKRVRLCQSSQSWMWVRMPYGRNVLTLVSTDYLLHNCVNEIDYWSDSNKEKNVYVPLPNGSWGELSPSGPKSLPHTKRITTPPQTDMYVPAHNPLVVDQNKNTGLQNTKRGKSKMVDHVGMLPDNIPSTSFQLC